MSDLRDTSVNVTWLIGAYSSVKADFASQEMFSNVWRQCQLSQLGEGAIVIQ